MKTFCQAPAKILLSGEHSVVYGAPGLSMTVNLPTTCQVIFTPADTFSVDIELIDYQQNHSFPFAVWRRLAAEIESRFHLFQQEIGSIHSVLQHPVDLVLVTLDQFHEAYRLKSGHWQIKIQSHPYSSRGFGSSAAVILSLLKSLFLQQTINITTSELLALAKKIESRQHGHSSGIDPTAIIYGGLLRFQPHHPVIPLHFPGFKGWLIDTGRPQTTTGQVVEAVAKRFKHNHEIWQRFSQVTEQIQLACETENSALLRQGVQSNHQLLCEIGVVPQTVMDFIAELHKTPLSAAKTCGAGASSGNAAGIVLFISTTSPKVLCEQYGFKFFPLELSSDGIICQEQWN